MRKFESSQNGERRTQSADSSKAFTINREILIADLRRDIFTVGDFMRIPHLLKLKHWTLGLHFQNLEW